MSLGKIVEQIKKAKVAASYDLSKHENFQTLAGATGLKNRAIQELGELTRQYRVELLRNSVFILVAGAAKDEFVAEASKDGRLFTASADQFYTDLVSKIPESSFGREGVSNLFDIFSRHLEDKANDLDLNRRVGVIFNQKYQRAIKGREDFLKLATEAVNDQIGGEIIGVNALTTVTKAAIEKETTENLLPILLTTSSDALTLEIVEGIQKLKADGNVVTVVAGRANKAFGSVRGVVAVKKVNEESVTSTLNDIISRAK